MSSITSKSPSLLEQTIHALRSQLTVFRFDEAVQSAEMINQISSMLSRVELIDQANRSETPVSERVNLSKLLKKCVSQRENTWERARLKLDAERSVHIMGDSVSLEAAVTELLDNALRYSDADVRVHCTNQGKHVAITIQDFGPGIPKLIEHQAMQPFVSLDGDRHSASGLGLAIAQAVIRKHGGTMSIHNNDGATVSILLPAQ